MIVNAAGRCTGAAVLALLLCIAAAGAAGDRERPLPRALPCT